MDVDVCRPAACSSDITSAISAAGSPRPCTPPSASRAGTISSGHGVSAPTSTNVRVTVPHFDLWQLNDQIEFARILLKKPGSTRDGGIRYGAAPEDILTNIYSAKKDVLSAALTKRAQYREENDMEREWELCPLGLTPEKKKTKAGVEPNLTGKLPRKTDSAVCRMICLLANDTKLLDMFVKSHRQPSRDELDRHAIGSGRELYAQLAIAMVDENWRSSDGNPISLPDDHLSDPKAPPELCNHLAALNLEAPARALRSCVNEDEDGNLLLRPIQDQLKDWIIDVKGKHAVSTLVRQFACHANRRRPFFLCAFLATRLQVIYIYICVCWKACMQYDLRSSCVCTREVLCLLGTLL